MKRFVCFLLTLVLIVSLVPATVLTASAASVLTTSDKAIEILKLFEGFSAKPYEDGGKWYIGYGTYVPDHTIYNDGITKSQATVLLKDHLEDNVDTEINKFAKRHNLALTQYQHDALALFTYNCGPSWMSGGVLMDAVVNGKRGNDFLNAMAEYNGANPSSDYFGGLLNRRLAEANMYLNNMYSFYKPSNYTYVVLNANGGTVKDAYGNVMEVFAYDTTTAPALDILAQKSGDTFIGWYLDGNPVYTLDATLAGKTLTAKWQGTGDGVAAKYDINSSEASSLNVYADHAIDAKLRGTLRANSKFSVTREFVDSKNVKWVYGTGVSTEGKSLTGWVGLCDLDEKDNSETVLATGVVTSTTLNVRDAATTEGAILGTLTKGTEVKILAYKNEYIAAGTRSWGKIMYNGKIGWIHLAYVDVKSASAEDNDSIYGKTGKIVNAPLVNIRSAAGVGNAKVAELKEGTAVTVYETVQIGSGTSGATWGRIKWDGIKEGWVYMYYVQLDGSSVSGSISSPDAVLYTGVVTSNTNLNVRREAKVTSAQVGSLPTGTRINIYEKTTTNGVGWGRTDNGWVCLLYVNLTATGNTGTGSTGNGNHVLVTRVGTVTAATLSLRKAATNNSEQLDILMLGDQVTILEQVTEETSVGSKQWGKVTVDGVTGWINLAYVDIKENTELIPDVDANPGTPTTVSNGVIFNCVQVNVRAAAGVRNPLVTTLANGTAVKVYEQVTKDGALWGRIDQGWVALQYVNLTGTTTGGTTGSTGSTDSTMVPGATTPGVISATGIVNSQIDLNVRAGAGLGYAKVGSLPRGTTVTIYEQKHADGMIWGKTNTGWVCMSYITITSSSSNTGSGTGVMGTVARCFSHVNVRSAPGTGNALVGTIQVGARVEVYEQRLYSGQYWGRVAQGWVCMQYIVLDGELPPTEDTPATTPSTGNGTDTTDQATVNNNPAISYSFKGTAKSEVNVRQDATVKAELKGTINAGTSINFVALKMNRTAEGVLEFWAKTTDFGIPGWINLANITVSIDGYVQVDNLTVYADATTASEGIGVLNKNQGVHVYDLRLDGAVVWGKLDVNTVNGVVGWIQMANIGYQPTAIAATDVGGLKGSTISAIDAFTSIDATVVSHKLAAGAIVYLKPHADGKAFNASHGIVWGRVEINGNTAFVDMSKIAYLFAGTVSVTELNVRNVPASNADSVVQGTLTSGTSVNITSLMAASDGSIWAQIQTSDALNGGWVDIQHLTLS